MQLTREHCRLAECLGTEICRPLAGRGCRLQPFSTQQLPALSLTVRVSLVQSPPRVSVFTTLCCPEYKLPAFEDLRRTLLISFHGNYRVVCCIATFSSAPFFFGAMSVPTQPVSGFYYDELSKIRALDPEIAGKTQELKDECKEFVDSKFSK